MYDITLCQFSLYPKQSVLQKLSDCETVEEAFGAKKATATTNNNNNINNRLMLSFSCQM